jgi:hypothetical protein
VDATGYVPETGDGVIVNGFYNSWGSAALAFYLKSSLTEPSIARYFCAASGNSSSTCNLTMPTVNRRFYYFADLVSGTNNTSQTTVFKYYGYIEDLGQF